MLLNRVAEKLNAGVRPRLRLLRARAEALTVRRPVILVPSVLGTRLADEHGTMVWGSVRRLFLGPAPPDGARPAGLLTGFKIVPGVWEYDVFGGLVRFLDHVGGWRLGEDLHVLEYDWRHGVLAAAEELDRLVDRVRGTSDEPVDLVCFSTGGLVGRAWLATAADRVRRVVYIGAPHRGSLMALDCLATGLRIAPGGRTFPAREVARVQTVWDALPHPDEKVFMDEDGRGLEIDLYDAAAWRRLGLDAGVPDLAERLARARAVHTALDAGAARHPEAFVIGGRHIPTPSKCLVRAGKARLPPCVPQPDDPLAGLCYEPGDATLVARSLCAAPGLRPADAWFVRPREHRMLPADSEVKRLVVEALLATDRAIPHTSLARRRRNGPAS